MSTKNHIFTNGKICYVQIPAIDINRSASFYKEVFGWQIEHKDNGHIAFHDGVEVSGMWVQGMKATTEPGLLIYIMVDNINTTIDSIIANGGKIVQSIGKDAPEVTARFSDPAGNVIGLYQQRMSEN